ncbi:MAG: MBL fold metallo-hydrolase [Bacteroidia bacterium]|nr:MBL fold metallo-hydrolase [Bacteroidia bacterium]
MNLYTIDTGYFKLDGGAMFGVVPKSIWHKLNPADEYNMINLAMRCLLVQDGKRLILIDNGMGNKQDDKFFSHYYLHGDVTLEKSLNKYGFTSDDITDMVLSHLHFDHCGGSIKWNADRKKYQTVFKNATYWIAQEHWEESQAPNPREKASFLKENILPIQESGQLKLFKKGDLFHPDIPLIYSTGHTNQMIHPVIPFKGRKVIYLADVIPTVAHIPIAYVMGYDVRPLETMKEKQSILQQAVNEGYILYFEHDPFNEACTVQQTDKGIRAAEMVNIAEL